MSGGVILLAAGFSRRFGSDKRLHALPDGTHLLMASLKLYADAFPRVIVILRPEDEALATVIARAEAGRRVEIIPCPGSHLGMGHSIACGARAAHDRGWSYAFVALADMAWVRPSTLARLQRRLEGSDPETVVQPLHANVPGHPVGFGAAHFPELARLTGDEGARSVVLAAAERLIRVAVDDPGVLEDLDTPPSP